MKLVIQIPCFNEEATLSQTLQDLPRQIDGVDVIEYQIIDDGSTDATVETARKFGVHHIVELKTNRGLAHAFTAGVENALKVGADILVNTDGDNQYNGQDIIKLVQPILEGRSDVVIGARPILEHPEFSFLKKKLQRLGSWVVRKVSNTEVEDTTSGFRAFNREALLRMNMFSGFSYTLETIIQAGLRNLRVDSRPVRVNPKTRDSRLFKSIFQYIRKSTSTIFEIGVLYRAKQFFGGVALVIFLFSLALVGRFLYRVTFMDSSSGTFWPSIVLAGVMLAIAFQIYLTGVLASLISSNRKLSEDILYRLRKLELAEKKDGQQPPAKP